MPCQRDRARNCVSEERERLANEETEDCNRGIATLELRKIEWYRMSEGGS